MKTLKNILILFILIISFTNCAKKKQNNLIGSWLNVPLSIEDTLHTEIWTFDAGDVFTYKIDTVEYKGNYTFISKTFSAFADISGIDEQLNNSYFDGLYKLEKINDDVLILQCEEPYKHKEFTRNK